MDEKTVKNTENPSLLMNKAGKGDKNAFGQLYELYYTPVYRYIYYKTSDKEVCNDLVQDVFIKVYSSLDRYSEQRSSPLPYFLTIARNTVIDYWRKKRDIIIEDSHSIFGNLEDMSIATPETLSMREQDHGTVHVALSGLKEDHKEVITLRFINQLSTKEIASVLNKSEDAIRQIQCRALKLLRKDLAFLKN